MLKRLSARDRYENLVSEWSPKLRQAFIDAIDGIRSKIVLRHVVERLEAGDVFGAVAAMDLDQADFHALDEAIRSAFVAGGIAAVEGMPTVRDRSGHAVALRWDMRSPAAQDWLRENQGAVIAGIVAAMTEGIGQELSAGLVRGEAPTRLALRTVGRRSRVTGKRTGGLIGLSSAQAQFVATARQELLSGAPQDVRNYLSRDRRDRRFDKTVIEADGKPIAPEMADRITAGYADKLLDLRADVIGRDQAEAAISAGFFIAFAQQIATGKVLSQFVTKTWRHTPQRNGRDQHIAMAGQTVAIDEPFVAPDGTRIQYPHAPGIPASHSIHCRCFVDYKFAFRAEAV